MLRIPTSAQRDLAVLVLAAALFALLSARLELAETIAAWTRPYERWQLDELPGVLLFVVAGLAWYAWRRACGAGSACRGGGGEPEARARGGKRAGRRASPPRA